jgi:hypothetical protein
MLKRRFTRNRDSASLPTTQKSNVDGSGLSVRMEAPILRAAKNASAYTRNSYIWCFSSIFLIYWSWNHIWYHYATTFLECDGDDCTLKILPPARGKKLTLKLVRDQIVSSEVLKVDINGEKDMGSFDSYGMVLNQYGKGAHVDAFNVQRDALKRKVEDALTEEDLEEMQNYGSAAFTDPDLKEQLHRQRRSRNLNNDAHIDIDAKTKHDSQPKKEKVLNYDLPNLDALEPYAISHGNGQYFLIMRKYNVQHRKRRVTSLTNKINLYAGRKKNSLTIQENRNVVWQAILGILLGVFSLLFSLLLGQFSEPEKKKTRGPGSRRNLNNPSSYSSNRTASIPQRQTRSQLNKPKAYGGYNSGKSSYSY